MRFRRTEKRAAAWMLLSVFALTACLVQAEEISEVLTEVPVQEEEYAELDALPDEEAKPEEPEETTPGETAPIEWSESEIVQEAPSEEDTQEEEGISVLQGVIESQGYAYVQTVVPAMIFWDAEQSEPFFLADESAVLLATGYAQGSLQVFFWTEAGGIQTGYAGEDALILLMEDGEWAMGESIMMETEAGMMPVFLISGQNQNEQKEIIEEIQKEETQNELDMQVEEIYQPGEFVSVTPFTRAYSNVDETAGFEDELFEGYFVCDANVRIENILKDGQGRNWYEVSYMFGPTDADGSMIETSTGTIHVLAEDILPAYAQDYDLTDYALNDLPPALYASDGGFSLRKGYGSIGQFSAGQTNQYANSGHDSEYKQIAKLSGHGTIYATPHYLNGHTVYCLEHTMNSPGTKHTESGPYEIVNLEGYARTPGYSGIIFRPETMHAIGWVMRHTYPYMVLDRGDASNDQWSRVAGQFAIREVIKQLEGAQYVRDYWRMDEFYRARDQAPGVYLEYARWLAAEGIARGRITGGITVSGKSASYADGMISGTVTLKTDADRIRISKSAGTLSGNSAGSDGTYYYLHSGDTVTVKAAGTRLSFEAESISSPDEEANFLIGVPSADIQKILIPQDGNPYPMKKVTVSFDMPQGNIIVHKTDKQSSKALTGAVFELIGANGGVIGRQTTGKDGNVTFSNLTPGMYTVCEVSAPEGYQVSVPNSQTITVTAGGTTQAAFANEQITAKIRIVKKDSTSKKPLAGAEFTVTRLSDHGTAETVSVLVTNETGCAETGWLEWGTYRVEETKVPAGYVKVHFVTEIEAKEDGKTYTVNAENTAITGKIKIRKTGTTHADRLLSGAVFEVRAAEDIFAGDGTKVYDRDKLVDTITTGKNGEAVTRMLPLGKYLLTETKAPEGYIISSEKTELTLSYENADTPVVEAEAVIPNLESTSKIRIAKRDSGTKKPLAGVEFTITRLSVPEAAQNEGVGEVAAAITTDETGYAETDWLEWGTYRVEETKVLAGYLDRRFVTEINAFEDGKTYEVEVENDPVLGQIQVKKTGLQFIGFEEKETLGFTAHRPVFEMKPLAGAEFEVRAAEQIIGPDGTVFFEQNDVADTIVTTDSGMDASKKLPLGKYVLVETKAPAGYVLDSTPHEVTLTFENHETPLVRITVEVENVYLPAEIKLRKEKEILTTVEDGENIRQVFEHVPGEGFVFGLFNAEPIVYGENTLPADTMLDAGVTGEDGRLFFSGKYPHGSYYLKELRAPDGWKINPNAFPVTLDPQTSKDNMIFVELEEAVQDEIICAHVKLTKKNITGEDTIPGALIEVKNEAGEVIYRSHTDENGELPNIPVVPGRYTFREILAPSGYELNTVEMTFTVHADGSVTGDAEIRDDYTRVQIIKQEENGKPLEGVEFGLFKQNGVKLMTAISDEQGVVTFEQIPYGKYKIRETKPLPYYYPSEVEVELTVDGTFINPEKPIQTITNERRQLHCIKVDTSGKYLAGVEFVLLDAKTEEIVETVTSNERGEFVFTKIAIGDWIIRESQAPAGYSRMEDVLLHVDESWREPEPIRCVNIPDHYEFLKVDENGRPLQGAKFTIEDEYGVLYEMVSDKDGIVHATDLLPGTYVIREIEAADGYDCTDETIHIVIDDRYVVPDEMRRLVNYPAEEDDQVIQTGVEIPWTPMMSVGVLMMLSAAVLAVIGYRKK